MVIVTMIYYLCCYRCPDQDGDGENNIYYYRCLDLEGDDDGENNICCYRCKGDGDGDGGLKSRVVECETCEDV